jgi:hypothetical protein
MAVCFCLFATLQAAGVFPLFLGLSASVEGTHAVSISTMPRRVSVVLHHRASTEIDEFQHFHGLASRIVCLLDKSAHLPQSDHIATFSAISTCDRSLEAKKTATAMSFIEAGLNGRQQTMPTLLVLSPAAKQLGSVSPGSLSATRTTVLLI